MDLGLERGHCLQLIQLSQEQSLVHSAAWQSYLTLPLCGLCFQADHHALVWLQLGVLPTQSALLGGRREESCEAWMELG